MPAPVVISPSSYVSPAAATIAVATDTSVAAGDTVVAVVAWYGSGTLNGLSGGGLTWTVHVTSGGTAHRIALASAHAPTGLASGTTVTATLSASRDARSIRLVSVADVAATDPADGTDSQPSTNTPAWAGTVSPSGPAVVLSAPWYDFYSAGLTATAGALVPGYEWVTAENSTLGLAYLDAEDAGTYTVSGTGGNNGRTSATVALLLADSGPTTHPLAGTIAATTASSGAPAARRALAGTVAATSGTAGTIGLRARLAGAVHATAAATGTIAAQLGLSGTITGTSTTSGAPGLRARLSGIVAAVSSVYGRLGGTYVPAPPVRTLTVSAEPRILTLPAEPRVRVVAAEDRTYRIGAP